MRVVVQRVERACVRVDGETVGAIGRGVLALVGIEREDSETEVRAVAEKLGGMRIFEDDQGKTNLDLRDIGGGLLVVSQFSLAGSLRKGRRPSFDRAAPPAIAEPLVDRLIAALRGQGHLVEQGRFRAQMKVDLVNDGPLTFVLDCREGRIVELEP